LEKAVPPKPLLEKWMGKNVPYAHCIIFVQLASHIVHRAVAGRSTVEQIVDLDTENDCELPGSYDSSGIC
jgi:hypothetical protein